MHIPTLKSGIMYSFNFNTIPLKFMVSLTNVMNIFVINALRDLNGVAAKSGLNGILLMPLRA